jgi:hypothetical protein
LKQEFIIGTEEILERKLLIEVLERNASLRKKWKRPNLVLGMQEQSYNMAVVL